MQLRLFTIILLASYALSRNLFAMDLAEDVLSSKDASTLRPSLPIDPVEDFLSQSDLKYKRPTLSIDQLRDLTHHCSKKMQYFDKILAGNNNIGTEDHFDFKKVLSVTETEGDNIPLSEFVYIIDQNIHQQTFCRKEQVFAKSIIAKTSQYYNLQWRIWEKRHHFFSNYNDSEWTEDSFSWPHLRKENTLLLNQIMLWTTILHNVTEWHETYKEKYDIVLCQPLVEQLSGESLNVTNNIVYRACSFSDSIKALKKLINNLKKIQPTLFLLCEHDEQRLSEIMYRLGFNGPSYNNAMHAGMDNFPKAVLNLEMLKSVYEKKALDFPMPEEPKKEDSSLLIAVTSSDALNVPHQNTIPTKPRSTSGNKPKLSITPPKFPSSLFTSSGSPRSASSHQASSSQESPERIAVDKEKHLSPHDEKKHPSPREVKKRSMFQKRPSYTHGASTPQRKISSEEKTDKPHDEKHGKKPGTKTAVIKDQSNATDKK